LRNIGILAAKEVGSYLAAPLAYVVTAVFLALTGTFFASYLAATAYSETTIEGFVEAGKYLTMLFAAVLTMRAIAEERKAGTWELLLTSPLADAEIVLGKFAGHLIILTGMLGLTLYYPILLAWLGDPDFGPMATSYLGLFLLGGASLSVGIFASSLTANQVVAVVVACGMLFALWFVGTAAAFAPGPLGKVLAYLSFSYHFADFDRGIIDTRAIVYFVSVSALFLYLAIRSIEAGRWQ
jgi:gliding motility-associated transport system permease protein